MSFEFLTQLCDSIVDQVKDHGFDEVIGISRGGLIPATLIAKELGLPCGVFYPQTKSLHTVGKPKKILFIDDLVAKGRTFKTIRYVMQTKDIEYGYVPILVDASFNDPVHEFTTYGIKTSSWVVFPWEKEEKVIEGDWGLFREGTAKYGG